MARRYHWLFFGLAVACFGVDQASKYLVFRWLYRGGEFAEVLGNSVEVVPGWFKLIAQYDPDTPWNDDWRRPLQSWNGPMRPRVNPGALFGLGQSHRSTANTVFAAISALAAIALLAWGYCGQPSRQLGLAIPLGLILGGTLGNLYDRVIFDGVRDFLYFYKIDWPVFNVADCCLVVGAAILMGHALFGEPSRPPSAPEPSAAASSPQPLTLPAPVTATPPPIQFLHPTQLPEAPQDPLAGPSSLTAPPTDKVR